MRAGRHLVLVGAVSQGAAVATVFSALGEPGPLFLLVSGLLLLSLWVYSGRRLPEGSVQVGMIRGSVSVAVGLGIWSMTVGELSLWTVIVAVGLGSWLWSRMQSLLINNPRQLRNQLLKEGKLDLVLILLAAGLAVVYEQRVDVEGEVVPLLLLFFWTRLLSLLLATRFMGSGKSSWAGGTKEGVPYLFVFGALLLILWSLPVFDPLWSIVVEGIMWIFYGVSILITPIVNWVKNWPQWQNFREDSLDTKKGSVPSENTPQLSEAAWAGWDILCLLLFLAALIGLILWSRQRKILRSPMDAASSITGEVRQFIRAGKRKSRRRPAPGSAPTWMRKQYRLFLTSMWKKGIIRRLGETPVEFAWRVGEEAPQLKETAGELTAYYMEERYGDLPVESRRERTTTLLERLKGR